MWRSLSWLGVALLAGCAARSPAPVVERPAPTTVVEAGAGAVAAAPAAPTVVREGFYAVKKGDTLYRIALEHGLDYKDLAAWNYLENAGRIEVGQQLRIVPPDTGAVVKPVAAPGLVVVMGDAAPPAAVPPPAVAPAAVSNTDALKREPRGGKVPYSEQALAQARAMEGGAAAARAEPVPTAVDKAPPIAVAAAVPAAAATPPAPAPTGDEAVEWTWPLAGKLLSQFVEGTPGKESNKGVDIAARMGEPVQAAAGGKVVYVGNSLRGYGNLVIVRHNATYLSAYAHNSRILVKEGQAVARGQKIAEVGNSDADQPKLHFEIRRQGKPVDPLKHLPAR